MITTLTRLLLPACVLASIVPGASAWAEGKHFPGIFGKDDRVAVSTSDTGFHAIGHVNVAGSRNRNRCTGTLIAPDRVVTAAHCLVEKGSGKLKPLSNIHFVAGVAREGYQGHAKAKCVYLAKPGVKRDTKSIDWLIHDVAIIILDRELDITSMPLVDEDIKDRPGLPLVHPSYPRDSRYRLVADSRCHLRGKQKGLWFTSCDTNHASSGGPVLVKIDRRFRLFAVMVGVVNRKFSVAVPITAWRPLLKNENCF